MCEKEGKFICHDARVELNWAEVPGKVCGDMHIIRWEEWRPRDTVVPRRIGEKEGR